MLGLIFVLIRFQNLVKLLLHKCKLVSFSSMFPQKLFYTLNVKSFQIEISIYRRHFSSIIVEFLEVIKI